MPPEDTNGLSQEFTEKKCPVTGASIKTLPGWKNIPLTKDFSVSFELVDHNIVRVFPDGNSTYDGMEALWKEYDRFLEAAGIAGKPYMEVSDYGGIANIPSQRTRKKVMETLLDKIEHHHLAAHLIYNVPRHIKWMFNIGARFYRPKSPMRVYDTFGQAYKASMNIIKENRSNKGVFSLFKKSGKTSRLDVELDKYTTELLKYIGAINWNREEHEFERLDETHPFSAVYDSLKILKTDLDASEKERRKIGKIYRTLFNHIADPTIVFDKETHQIYDCNYAFLNVYGYTLDELRQMTPQMFHPEDERERVTKNINNKNRPRPNYYTHHTKYGETIEVEIRTDETQYKGQDAWISTFLDITERNRLERELKAHRNELEKLVEERTRELEEEIAERRQAQAQLEKAKDDAVKATRAKSEFLANMSHEIRTPMNGIMGMVELVLDTRLKEDQKALISTINTEAESLLTIINSVLDFSKIEAGKLELDNIPFNLRFLLEDLSDVFAVTASKNNLEMVTFLPPEVPERLIGDPGRLRQVFTNLVGNALKFTREGEIFIWADTFQASGDQVEIKFCIKDTGIGIPEDKQGKIFESFSQADGSTTREYGGTGLGTTISKQLVTMMGGQIGFESTPGKGTTFWFTACFEKDGSPVEPGRTRPELQADLEGLHILVVDDNDSNRLVLSEHLKSWGCIPHEEKSAGSAIEMLNTDDGNKSFDMILCDFKMPGMNGFELVEHIRDSSGLDDLPIIILTSMGMSGDSQTCKSLGIKGYLTKPVKRNDLKEAIISIITKKEDLHPEKNQTVFTKHSMSENRLGKPRILLVEDYITNQVIATRQLTREGFDVIPAGNGKNAVELFRKKRFDLILMDIQMPVMDGYEACRKIRAAEASLRSFLANNESREAVMPEPVPIIAMTAHALEGYKEQCLDAGMDDYITKPFKKKELISMVEKWLPGQKTASQPLEIPLTDDGSPPPLDLEKALFEFDDETDFFIKILDDFISTVENQVPEIRQGVQDTAFEQVRKLAHAMKGAAGSLTADKMYLAAKELEASASGNDITGIHTHAVNLENAFEDLKAYSKKIHFIFDKPPGA